MKPPQTLHDMRGKTEQDVQSRGTAFPASPCDRCRSIQSSPMFHSEDHLTGEPFDVIRCGGCGLLRTDLRDRGRDLSQYYGPAYYGNAGRRFRGALEGTIGLFRKTRARQVARLAGPPGRILDLGCGRGLMLAALQGMGWQCVGTEVSASLTEAARLTHGFEVVSENTYPLPFPDASFDAVTAWHSLEHMERPIGTLGEIFRILKPGGLLVVEVPNASSFQARLGGRSWFHLDVPRHLYHFSRPEVREILAGVGYSVLKEGTLSLEQGPYGMAQSILNRATFRPNVLYRLLKRVPSLKRPARTELRRLQDIWDLAATAILALPAGAAGTGLEVLAALLGRGGVTRLAARKPS